ncbi:M20/M25/M40 family metallo-hydrolase [Microbacterium flavum]|uniref:M20/M25/M40 family metallo-hydrolase n=1 Tax=Microbacterium flavum TaxID=415216 RepID=A0ABS5XV00_9MICO|nr:M20/M25/M40 family metallo-hydrolase [Microbacterium flavum]MBT8798371.1 M20/M25/M40 family metallo-hydrolase [Microbacterium flavum]
MPESAAASDHDAPFRVACERLERLVAVETPSRDAAASAEIAELLAGWWNAAGARVETVVTDAGVCVVADVAGVGAPVLLVGHSDTVWPRGTLQGEVPWVREGDVVRGPGTYDMKSGLVTMLAAVEATRDLPRRAVRVVVVCDEEVGSPTTTDLLRDVSRDVSAVVGFEAPHPDGALKVGRRGSTRLQVSVTGRASHAALDPRAGVSAIDELVDQLLAIRDLVADPSLPSQVLCNVGTVSGGTRANVVSASASAEIGLRFEDPDTEALVLDRLLRLSPIREGSVIEVVSLSRRPAWSPSSADRALAARLRRAAERNGQILGARPAAGAGDANQLGSWGIPTVDGMGPRGGGAHAASEHILLSSLRERIALLATFLLDVDDDRATI